MRWIYAQAIAVSALAAMAGCTGTALFLMVVAAILPFTTGDMPWD